MSGLLSTLATGVAVALDEAGVGQWEPAVVPTGGTGALITVGLVPATPDRVVVVTAYGVTDTTDEHSTVGMQVRTRAGKDPRGAYDLDDAAFAVLHRPRGWTVGGIPVAVSYRASGPTVLGQDSNGRTELTSNYYLLVPRASVDPWA